MKKAGFFLLFIINSLFGESLDMLLKQYKSTVEQSLQTVDEKLGHVIIYSQEEIRKFQYQSLNDILKELPLMSMGKNKLGNETPLLTGSKSVSGFFRFFINDYEFSSAYLHSPSFGWADIPLDFIDHIEIYYGDSSFKLGDSTGVYFVRIYTKSAKKENGTQLQIHANSENSHSQSIMHSQSFEDGWSYLFFANNSISKENFTTKDKGLYNNKDAKFFFADISNETTKINFGYTDAKKDIFTGMSLDADPDSGEMEEKSYFLDVTSYFLYDESLKANFSIGVNQYQYDEENSEGIGFLPLIDFSDPYTTTPITLYQDLTFSKINASLLKTFQLNKHTLLTGVHFFSKSYDTSTFSATNSLNQEMDLSTNDFDKENTYSFLLQDDYKVFDNLTLLANFKIDKYIREGSLKNSTERLFRVGAIYTPYENLGFKTFFTKTYLPVSFYNVDFENIATPELNSQQYQYYTAEMAYTYKKSKLNIIYNYTTIDDFIYLTQ